MIRRIVLVLCCLVLGGAFLVAALPKLLHPAAFAVAIYRYQLAPHGLIDLLAVYLPWIELIAAIGLFVPWTRKASAGILAVLLLVFTAAIAINLHRGLDMACGCFSTDPASHRIGTFNLVRNLVLFVAAAFIAAAGDRRRPSAGA